MPQSINKISLEHYRDKYDKKLIAMADQENKWKRFMVGSKVDKDKFLHTVMMHEKTCVDNCDMLYYIWDKIEGKLKDKCPPKQEGFYKTMRVYEEVVYKQTQSEEPCDIVGDCVPKIEW